MKDAQYVWIRKWEEFQHYAHRNPAWIKFYTELLHDESYLDLSTHQRGVLHGLWLAFATSRRRLHADTGKLSRRLGCRVLTADLASLSHAGFLDIVASSKLAACERRYSKALASRAPAQSQDKEVDRDKDKEEPSAVHTVAREQTKQHPDFTIPNLKEIA